MVLWKIVESLRGNTAGAFCMSKGGTKCQRNQNDHVLLLVVLSWQMDVFVRSMQKGSFSLWKISERSWNEEALRSCMEKNTWPLHHSPSSVWRVQKAGKADTGCWSASHPSFVARWDTRWKQPNGSLYSLSLSYHSKRWRPLGNPVGGVISPQLFKCATGVGLRAKSRGFKRGNNL